MQYEKRLFWSIGGFDPSGGAGSLADCQTAGSMQVGCGVILTALTVQNRRRFQEAQPMEPSFVREQLNCLGEEGDPEVIKVSLIPSNSILEVLLGAFEKLAKAFIIFDPVRVSSSGGKMGSDLDKNLLKSFIGKVDLLTPNLMEASEILGVDVKTKDEVARAGESLFELGVKNVLIKGGHQKPNSSEDRGFVFDFFASKGSKPFWLSSKRYPGSIHGSGCILGAAIASAMVRRPQDDLIDHVVLGKAYVSSVLKRSTAEGVENAYPVHGEIEKDSFPDVLDPGICEGAFGLDFVKESDLGFYPIVDSSLMVERLANAGCKAVQLRIKQPKSQGLLEEEILRSVDLCNRMNVKLYINDYWKLAISCGAYGVHLGQEDLDTADLSAISTAELRLGVSTHSYAEASRAMSIRPSYIALGPVFETTAKPMRFGPQGLERVREWKRFFDRPLVAIGGISIDDARDLREQGADSIAVISDLKKGSSIEDRCRAWLNIF